MYVSMQISVMNPSNLAIDKGACHMPKKVTKFLSIIMCLLLYSTVLASSEKESCKRKKDFTWTTMREKGYLKANKDGLLEIADHKSAKELPGYDDVVDLIKICNESIKDGIIILDKKTLLLKNSFNPGNIDVNYVPPGLRKHFKPISLRNGAHGCSTPALNLLHLCENNYNTLSMYHESMVRIAEENPGFIPFPATSAFWIAKVRPNGEWDYKVRPGFAPWNKNFCCYLDQNFSHLTSEYIGNFNYGYTGSFLFSLEVLHFGSYAVSGFDSKDTEDWPAIDAGYRHATKNLK